MQIDSQAYAELASDLAPGERILWAGRPDSSRLLFPGDLAIMPFAFIWTTFAVLWEFAALSTGGPGDVVFKLWGIPFIAIGVHMLFGRLITRRRVARRTSYGITDLRATAVCRIWWGRRQTSSVWLGSGPAVTERAGRNSHGTLIVGSPGPYEPKRLALDLSSGFSTSPDASAVVFWNIAEADEVNRLLVRAISEATAARQKAPAAYAN